jgi:septal ring factor EnvC (AmiA/AmiB activator)
VKRRRRAGALLLALALALAVGATAAERSADLDRLRQAIDASRERVTRYERDERGMLEALEALETSAALLEKEVIVAEREAEQAATTLAGAEAAVTGAADRVAVLERSMSGRAVALYRAGELGAVPLLFSAGDLREFLSRVQTLRQLLTHDASLLTRHRRAEAELEAARAHAREAADASITARANLKARSGELQQERAIKQRLVQRLRRSRSLERSALAELETAARALEEAVAALPQGPLPAPAPKPSQAFATLRGKLRAPVAGKVSRGFGRVVESEFKTATFRKGVEFDVPIGTAVRAVAEGQVRFAGRFRGYGNTVIVDHGDQYFTVFAHLSRLDVAVGDAVEPGRAIALSGETGSLHGPLLYFEVRRGGKALDPRSWLR